MSAKCQLCERAPGLTHDPRCPAGGGGRVVLDHARIDAAAHVGVDMIRAGVGWDEAAEMACRHAEPYEHVAVRMAVERRAIVALATRPDRRDMALRRPTAELLDDRRWEKYTGNRASGDLRVMVTSERGETLFAALAITEGLSYGGTTYGHEIVEVWLDTEDIGGVVDVTDRDYEGQVLEAVAGMRLAA